MGRPLKKALFGNTNFGLASTTSDDGLGGGSMTRIFQYGRGSPIFTGTLTVIIDPPEEPGGVQATATATYNVSGDLTFVVTNPGSGYRNSAGVQVTSTSGQNSYSLHYFIFTEITGSVEHIRCTANILGLSNDNADIVEQISWNRFRVKNANGTAIAKVSPTGAYYYGNCPDGYMFFYCTDNASARYVVSKITAHRLTLWQDPTSTGWLFASSSQVPWVRASGVDGPRTDASVTLDTLVG